MLPSQPLYNPRANEGNPGRDADMRGNPFINNPREGRSAFEGSELNLPAFHKGGKVKRTGAYRLLKGERVLSRKQNRKVSKLSEMLKR